MLNSAVNINMLKCDVEYVKRLSLFYDAVH